MLNRIRLIFALAGLILCLTARGQSKNAEVIDLANCPTEKIGVYQTDEVLILFEANRYKNLLLSEISRFSEQLKQEKSEYYLKRKQLYEKRLLELTYQMEQSDSMFISSYENAESEKQFFWNDLYFVMQVLNESQGCIYNKFEGKFEDRILVSTELEEKLTKYTLENGKVIFSGGLKF